MLRSLASLVLLLFSFLSHAKDLSLGEIRATLLGQQVVILGATYFPNTLVGWYRVEGDETTGFSKVSAAANFKRALEGSDNVSAKLMRALTDDVYVSVNVRGKRGLVVSVEEAETSLRYKKSGQTDVFGKRIDDSRVTNPNIQVVVKMNEDGLLIGTTGYFGSLLGSSFQLASRMDTMRSEVEGYLSRLVGKTLYKAGYTKLLDPTLSLQDLLDRNKRELSRDYETKNLTPLKVVDAKFLEEGNAVVIKVELPNGVTRLLFGDLNYYDHEVAYKQTMLDRMGISAEEKIPSRFSPKEIASIKEENIFVGMSKDALYWSWGYPEKTNDWGRGGAQLIYPGGQYVYVQGNVVRDWQVVK